MKVAVGVGWMVALCFATSSTLANDKPPVSSAPVSSTAQPLAASEEGPKDELPERKTEWAALPIISGSADTGFSVGASAIITGAGGDAKPYRWQIELIAAPAFKGGPRGFEVTEHHYGAAIDVPQLFGTRLRYSLKLYYTLTRNEVYFGLGNDAIPDPHSVTQDVLGKSQYVSEEIRARNLLRFPLLSRSDGANQANETWTGLLGLQLRGASFTPYPGSKLESDIAQSGPDGRPYTYPRTAGLNFVLTPSLGVAYDTRDNEVFAQTGLFWEASARFAFVAPEVAASHAGANVTVRQYLKLADHTVLASRLVVDSIFGKAPFYDLADYGSFSPVEAIGGAAGVRGIPVGLYMGRLKAFGNIEFRTMPILTKLFGSPLRLGADVFFDAGRSWMNYTFDDVRDGKGLGIRWGVGGGILVQYGSAALFRLEAAYAPQARIANPGFPLAIYLTDDLAF
ncbi:MAG: BamA/TamA family outer membrane protein [Polyangiaceae bacterium]|nr:BamA/TamA family outer membrane protein [Polyangiaceae bacterium]